MSTIKIKHRDKPTSPWYRKYEYYIYSGSLHIGTIKMTFKKHILIIGYLEIFEEYRNQHYGYQVVEYLLSHYKAKCIIGESMKQSRGFWNKCIHSFNGQRKNIISHSDCSSSFVIPRYRISDIAVYELLDDIYYA